MSYVFYVLMTNDETALAKSDIKSGVTPKQLHKLQIGRRLAKLIYFDDLNQSEAIQRIWPHLMPESARQNATRILNTYNVTGCLYDLLPNTIATDAFERIWHYLSQRAFKRSDEKLLLELMDRHAKATGKYKEALDVNMHVDQVQVIRAERARKVLAAHGHNPDKLLKDA